MTTLIELFSGNGDISQAHTQAGGTAYKVDWSTDVVADLHADVSTLTAQDIITLCNGVPDVLWASPQCTTYSIATHRHRTMKDGLRPKTELAKQDDERNIKLWQLIDDLLELGMKHYFVENPRGRMRHMPFVANRPRYEITYCSYGSRGTAAGFEHLYMNKPTDIWTNHPNPQFKRACIGINKLKHDHGSQEYAHKRDYLNRGLMPHELVQHIASLNN